MTATTTPMAALAALLKADDPDPTEAAKNAAHLKILANTRETATGCWEWTGATDGKGVGTMRLAGRLVSIARAAALVYLGGFSPGDSDVRILRRKGCCRNCVNPDHLRVSTLQDMPRILKLNARAWGAGGARRTAKAA